MARIHLAVLILMVGILAWPTGDAGAQQVQITAPYQQLRDSFYENINLGGFRFNAMGPRGGAFFNWGGAGANSTPPPFGGYDPGADARVGGGAMGGGFNFGFGGSFGTGSTRTNSVESPTIVIPNGGTGSLFDGSQRPFVLGVIPVVGEGVFTGQTPYAVPAQAPVSPLQERLGRLQQGESPSARRSGSGPPAPRAAAQDDEGPLAGKGGARAAAPASRPAASSAGDSSANHGDLSVAEIRRQQTAPDATRQAELKERLEKARSYEEAGNLAIARVYYQQAAARATGEQKQQLLDKIQSLSSGSSR